MALSPAASLFNHTCVPNCVTRWDHFGRLEIVATRHVAATEELTICYSGGYVPAAWRQNELASTYNFHCGCAKCRAAGGVEEGEGGGEGEGEDDDSYMLVDASMSGLMCQASRECGGLLNPVSGGAYECVLCDARQSVDRHREALQKLESAIGAAGGGVAKAVDIAGCAGEGAGGGHKRGGAGAPGGAGEGGGGVPAKVVRAAKATAAQLSQALKGKLRGCGVEM